MSSYEKYGVRLTHFFIYEMIRNFKNRKSGMKMIQILILLTKEVCIQNIKKCLCFDEYLLFFRNSLKNTRNIEKRKEKCNTWHIVGKYLEKHPLMVPIPSQFQK